MSRFLSPDGNANPWMLKKEDKMKHYVDFGGLIAILMASLFFISCSGSSDQLVSAAVFTPWHTFYGSGTTERAYGVAVDNDDNTYIVGRSISNWDGPAGQPPLHAHSNSGAAQDIVVLKLDKNGTYLWHTFYGSTDSQDYARGVVIDQNSNVYISGFSCDSWDGPNTEPPLHAYTGSGGDADGNAFILKLDSAGTYQWHTFYGSGADYDDDRGIALDADANIYLAMKSYDTWDVGLTAPLHAYAGSTDLVVIKLDKDGVYQWHTFYGSVDEDECNSIAVGSDANIYVTGYSTATWDAGATGPLHAHSGGDDITVFKLNSAGAYQWHTFYGSAAQEWGNGITLDGSGNVYVAGFSAATWDAGATGPLHAYAGGHDITVLKLNSAGAYQWHTFYGSAAANDYGNDLVVDHSGGIYVAGRSLASWQSGNSDNPLHAYTGGEDIMNLKLDSDGHYQWHTFYGSALDDRGQDIALDSRGVIHTVGYSQDTWLGYNDSAPLHSYSGSDDMFDLCIAGE